MTDKTRVLIVDDDARFTRTLSDILATEGFVPTVAAEGKTALEAIRAEPPATAELSRNFRRDGAHSPPAMGGTTAE